MNARLASIDLLRGMVMVLMALDHVRDYFSPVMFDPADLSRSEPALFATRWITHFCAPVFVFLAGTSAWLYRSAAALSAAELSRFLMLRGLWIVFAELTFINMGWTFQAPWLFMFLQVMWAIGVSMLVLGLLVRLPSAAVAGIGALLVLGHNALDGIRAEAFGAWAPLWMLLHEQGFVPFESGSGIFIAYPLIPWIGVMALGYCFGSLLQRPDRLTLAFRIGLALTVTFLILRATQVYGDPKPWAVDPRGPLWTLMAFLNTEKYPPSLLFLCMTIGPALMALPLLERARGALAGAVTVFGRVPFFFYVVHVPLIHASAILWSVMEYGSRVNFWLGPAGMPEGYEPSLLRAYFAWLILVVALWFPCRWYAAYKMQHRDKRWLTYL